VQNALESAHYGDPAPFRFPAQQPAPSVQCFDPQVEQMDEQSFIALGEQIVEKIKAYDATPSDQRRALQRARRGFAL
jgi:hypothetical protein